MKYIKNTIIVFIFLLVNLPQIGMGALTPKPTPMFFIFWMLSSGVTVFFSLALINTFKSWFDKQLIK
jgi:hypothetical protein